MTRVVPRCAIAPVLALCLFPALSCGGGGSGSGSSRLEVVAAYSESGPILPEEKVHLNEAIAIRFSTAVDPDSVSPDSVQVRSAASAYSTAPPGHLVVKDDTVFFYPSYPLRPDVSDTGFHADSEYRVRLPGHPDPRAVRSTGGDRLGTAYTVTFKTRLEPPFLLDVLPGPPDVVAVAIDIDLDGEIEADGDLETAEPEEISLQSAALMEGAPPGLARSPLSIGIFCNEPLHPASLLTAEGGVREDLIVLRDERGGIIPTRISLELRQPRHHRPTTLLRLTPERSLPRSSLVLLTIGEGITDLGSGGSLAPRVIPLLIGGLSGEQADFFVEDFDAPRRRDPLSSAQWGFPEPGVLQPGNGIAGNGIDGDLEVREDEEVVLDTTLNAGLFQFRSVMVNEGGRIIGKGPLPLRILCTGDIVVRGEIVASGAPGGPGEEWNRGFGNGGAGGPGGYRGGNSVPESSGESGEAPFDSPRSGGEGGGRNASAPGGGGGGGHLTSGTRDPASRSGEGGDPYSLLYPDVLRGGAGGGAGGLATGSSQFHGGGGGGGGGALLLSAAGRLVIGDGYAAWVSADGGDGGNGARVRAPARTGGAAGGGGAGGTIVLRGAVGVDLGTPLVRVSTRGGPRGNPGGGAARFAGAGSPGRVAIETFDTNGNGMADDAVIDAAADIAPLPLLFLLEDFNLPVSIGQSVFLDTGSGNPSFAFDGTELDTGLARTTGSTDLAFRDPPRDGVKVRVTFEGAHEDPSNPGQPDPATFTDPRMRIEELDGHRFVRFLVEIDLGPVPDAVRLPTVEGLRIRFRFED